MSNLTDKQVERIGRRVVEMVKEARSNPRFLEKAKEKLALFSPATREFLQEGAKRVGLGLGLGAGVTGGVAAFGAIQNKIQERNQSIEKAKSYKKMMGANPNLQDAEVDAQMVQRHFNTLHKFNPEYASDPMVAGTYVRNSLEMARPNIETLNNIVRARSAHVQSQKAVPHPVEKVVKPIASIAEKWVKG